ncbi:ComEC/Rec2 family competence protein [Clostridium oryzae]|uniref:ComEC family competence protein n=1 Tax=Clostridium oryzae TaxID=1450648 RepID=A0A1V4IUT2_9CLOT|nr:ComEC/Rec2 family competence protein [Clostridium oryzae]OPJ63792.1 ComEC family competence protein [Clostridium oryzae]
MIEDKPIVYYSIFMIFGCFESFLILNRSIAAAMILAVFFLFVMFCSQKCKFVLIGIVFFLAGCFNYYIYFNMNISKGTVLRVVNVQQYYITAIYDGRKITAETYDNTIKAGDKIFVQGEFKKEPEYEKGIIGRYKISKIVSRKQDYISSMYIFKEKLYAKLKQFIGDEYAGNVLGAAFGDTSHISSSSKNDMNQLGIVHIISVSGMHMALIYKIFEEIAGFKAAVAISIFYCILTGTTGATVRSLIMIFIYKLSKKVYKNYDAICSLAFSSIIIFFIYPYAVLDIGCILSFMAMLGIILYYETIRKKLVFMPSKLNEYISLSLSAQIFTLPVIIITFNFVSTDFLQGNIFLVPLYSGIVVLGNLAAIVMNIDLLFKAVCTFININMQLIDLIKDVLIKLSFGGVYLSYIDAMSIMVIYICSKLYKYINRKYLYLPVFMIIIYMYYFYSIPMDIAYIKIASKRGVILRQGFSSIAVVSNDIDKNKYDILKKKFNVKEVFSIAANQQLRIKVRNENILVGQKDKELALSIASYSHSVKINFVKNQSRPYNGYSYGIIYIPYRDSRNYYDELVDYKAINGKTYRFK